MDKMNKKDDLNDIYNYNQLNITTDINATKFNEFIFSNDLKLLGKLLHRHLFFTQTKDLPGDIVEIGVFKGSGVCTFSKFIDIFCPNSHKKVIGFDLFNENNEEVLNKYSINDKNKMMKVYSRVNNDDLSLNSVNERLCNSGSHKYMLIKGDVEESIPLFIEENPGLKISILYIDVDLEQPTYISLKYLWDKIVPGGIIVFDEYQYHKFSESIGVDKFFKELNLKYEIKSTNWVAPTAYIIKN